MLAVDVFCPLYNAKDYIERLINGIKIQKGVQINKIVFGVTESTDGTLDLVKTHEQVDYFVVKKKEFSHSLVREKGMSLCVSPVVIFLSQDVIIENENAFYELSKVIDDKTVYAYGRQLVKKKTVEYYTRKYNYPDKSSTVTKDDIERLQLKAFFSSDAFAAYNREVFFKLNGYDNIPMMFNEDMYYAKKILETGYTKAYVAEAEVVHSHKFTLKMLYRRYRTTGTWFKEHKEFQNYKATDSGVKLALFVLGQALKDFNIPVLFRWLPDMTARYLGMKKGKREKTDDK